jgi:RHS repeat-associated protein
MDWIGEKPVKLKIMLSIPVLWAMVCLSARAGTVTYIYTDPQGTPLLEVDANGVVLSSIDYAPYGAQALGGPVNGPGYTGHINDADTGYVYMQARFYDPMAGRFLSVDPIRPRAGDYQNFNRFMYGNNNPIRNIDPDGRQSAEDYKKLEACAGACSLVYDQGAHEWQARGQAVAGASVVAQASNSNVSNYVNPSGPTRHEAAAGLDNVSTAMTATSLATIEVPPVAAGAGVIDDAAAIVAFTIEPTVPRFLNVVTLGTFRLTKKIMTVKRSEKGLEKLEKTETANKVLTVADEATRKENEENPHGADK